jgi:biotin transport system substrate-specific component
MESKTSVKDTVFVSIFTALTVIGGYIAIPVGPVPIVLSNFIIILSGLLLGSKRGAAVAFTYLLLGALGLPVFSAGRSGIAHMAGPLGGYLLGYIPAAFITGLISEKGKHLFIKDILALSSGALAIYLLGVPWLKFSLDMLWKDAILAGMIPFLAGDAIKVSAAALIGVKMVQVVRGILNERTGHRDESA